jgi:pimeloyl-ACP methyl ester carboxylesterase
MCRALLDGRLVVFARSGHCPMFEVPDEFNRALLGFSAIPT